MPISRLLITYYLGRPPLNLLRQELAGTSIYLDVLQKVTSGFNDNNRQNLESNGSQDTEDTKLEGIAEERLISFCEQVLKDATDLQSTIGETTNVDIHRVLELRSPIIIKVLYQKQRNWTISALKWTSPHRYCFRGHIT